MAGQTKNQRIARGLYRLPPNKHGDIRYRVDVEHLGRKTRRLFPNLAQARQALDSIRMSIHENRWLPSKRREVRKTFESACADFLTWGKTNLAQSTASQDGYLVNRWLASPLFKGKTLDMISVGDVEAYKQARRKEVGPRQTDYTLSRLKRMFSLCLKQDLCSKNPVQGVKFFNTKTRRERVVEPSEEIVLLEHMDPMLRPVIVFALHTGLRIGEILALSWAQVNFKVGAFGQVSVRGETAKDREDRHVPLTATAKAVLDNLPRAINKDSVVFVGFGGRANFYKLWYQGIEAAKLNKGVPRHERITVHTLRHTYASRLVERGVDLATVQKVMGHSSIGTTMRYAHLAQAHVEKAVLVLDPVGNKSVIKAAGGESGAEQ